MAVGSCQSFQFLKQTTWFLGNERALYEFTGCVRYNFTSLFCMPKKEDL